VSACFSFIFAVISLAFAGGALAQDDVVNIHDSSSEATQSGTSSGTEEDSYKIRGGSRRYRRPRTESKSESEARRSSKSEKTSAKGSKDDSGDQFQKKHPILFGFGMVAVVLAAGCWIVGHIMMLIATFRTGILWGLGYLFLPFVGLIYICVHWSEAKKPLSIMCYGVAIVAIVYVVGHMFV